MDGIGKAVSVHLVDIVRQSLHLCRAQILRATRYLLDLIFYCRIRTVRPLFCINLI